MGNKFNDNAYSLIQDLINEHDDAVAEIGVQLDEAKFVNKILEESLISIRQEMRAWLVDLAMLVFTEPPEILRGKIYAMIASFPKKEKNNARSTANRSNTEN